MKLFAKKRFLVLTVILLCLLLNFNINALAFIIPDEKEEFVQIWVNGYGEPSCIEYSSDGSKLAIASSIGIFIFDSSDYSLLRKFVFNNESVKYMCWSPDNSKIAFSVDKEIRIIDSITGRKISSFNKDYNIGELKWSPDGKKIAAKPSSSSYYGLRIFDAFSGDYLFKIPLSSWNIDCFSFNPNSDIITYSSEGNITIMDISSNSSFMTISCNTQDKNYSSPYSIERIKYSPDGTKIAYSLSCHKETDEPWDHWENLQIIDAVTGDLLSFSDTYMEHYWNFIWSPDGTKIIGTAAINDLYVFNSSDLLIYNRLNETYKYLNASSISAMSMSSVENHIAITGGSNWIKIMDIESFNILYTIQEPGMYHESFDIVYCPTKDEFAYVKNGNIQIFNSKNGKLNRVLSGNGYVSCLDWSPDGEKIAYESTDSLDIINAKDGNNLLNISKDQYLGTILWSPDGKKLLSSGWNGTKIWNSTTGELIFNIDIKTEFNYPICWSSNSNRIIIWNENNFSIFDTDSGNLLKNITIDYLAPDRVWSIDDESNGVYIAAGYEHSKDRYIGLWDENNQIDYHLLGLEYLDTSGGLSPSVVKWSPDRNKIACNYYGVVIWDYYKNEVQILKGGLSTRTFTWSSYGDKIISCHTDGSVRGWGYPTDIVVKGTNITFSKNSPTIGDNITVFIDIMNQGKLNASNFWVDIYVDDVKIDEKQIYFLEREGGIKTIETFFTPTKKEQKVKVIVDSDNFLQELNKENNIAKVSINSVEEFDIGNQIYIFMLVGIILILLIIILYYKRKK